MRGGSRPFMTKKEKYISTTGTQKLPPINVSERDLAANSKGKSLKTFPMNSKKKGNDNRSNSSGSTKFKDRFKTRRPISAKDVMDMNKDAMSLMKNGKLKKSHETLKAALTAAEAGVRRCQENVKGSDTESHKQREVWLLAFATTLSNFGCLQRRDNNLQDALRYMQDAQTIEIQVFGKPSCSTMVNLSAVLLGLGATEEALSIAHDCALASEQSDPLLHIIALHNYGVTLSHHGEEEKRQLAASVLMKALRQAESNLGKDHPTTIMIREHCGMAFKKTANVNELHGNNSIASSSLIPQREEAYCDSQTEHASNTQKRSAVLPPLHYQQAKKALQSLEYGKMPLTATSFSPSESRVSTSLHSDSIKRGVGPHSSSHSSMFALPPLTPIKTAVEKDNDFYLSSLASSNNPVSVYCEEFVDIFLQNEFSDKTLSTISEIFKKEDEVVASEEKISQDVKKIDTFLDATAKPTDGANKMASFNFSVVSSENGVCWGSNKTEASEYKYDNDDGKEKDIQFVEKDTASDKLSATRQSKRAALCGEYIVINPQEKRISEPSYYRFAPQEKTLTQSTPIVETPVASIEPPKPVCEKLFMEFDDDDDEEYGENCIIDQQKTSFRCENKENTKEKDVEACLGTSPANKMRETFFKVIGVSPVERRLERIKKEHEEEIALRARLSKEAKEAAQKEYFERTLNAIITRTRNRAAAKIQYRWCKWWQQIGKRRRELLIKREEERARRERSRLAIIEHERRVAEMRMAKNAPIQKTFLGVATSVLRCGKRWLERTGHVRYLARCKISCNGEKDTFFALKVAKIQAAWRGYYTRQNVRKALAWKAQFWIFRRQNEIKEYAAIVIQLAFRRYIAKKVRKLNAFERYEPPAVLIQRWFRHFMPCRRALSLDKMSKWRRAYSARLIQRAWRNYCARLNFFMARLRYKLDEDRRRERTAAQVLQRIGRGFCYRRNVAKSFLKEIRLRAVMCAIESKKKSSPKKTATAAAAKVSSTSAYVPTSWHEVEAVAALEREKYHIGLFVDVVAARERANWAESLRVRPFDVLRRRAHEDHLCQLELNAFRRERAARKIQKEFRRWLRIRDKSFDGNALLLISRGVYQVGEYDKKISRIRHEREQKNGRELFGDQVAPMREEKIKVQKELEETRPLVRTHVPLKDVRCPAERYDVEKNLQRDEKLVEKLMQSDIFAKRHELALR